MCNGINRNFYSLKNGFEIAAFYFILEYRIQETIFLTICILAASLKNKLLPKYLTIIKNNSHLSRFFGFLRYLFCFYK